ncbi:late embryogenesis abundant protein Lea14-A-like [Mercurialis annua]|uniref:late embryogenesis abundant protein Lea14-A-like n=1 Tax=Mercurialis annua TaxID=3986 RepID=UPI00215EA50F|nr:late embryogenesis abundant protein Lea14-A-like [Mercurialis annua]
MGMILGKFVKKPEAKVTDLDLVSVHRDRVQYKITVSVFNPYFHPLPIVDVPFSLKSDGRVIISGKLEDPGSLKANDTTILTIPFAVPHDVIVSLVKDVGKDWDIDYDLELGLTIDLPLVGGFTIPLNRKGQIKLPTFKDLL